MVRGLGIDRRGPALVLGLCLVVLQSPVANGQGKDAGKSSPAALTMYADAANYQNNSAFELAAEEWTRFLERFADDPLAPKARHYLGVCQVQLKEFAKAAETFQAVIARHPQFEQLEDTYLNLGWCQYSLARAGDTRRHEDAAATFGTLATSYPKGKYADQALYFEAESRYALGQRKEAALAYGRLVTTHGKSKLRCDALYALGVTLEELNEWAQAGRAYDMFLEDCGKHALRTEVRMRKAETVLQSGDVRSAETLFADVAKVEGFGAADHALVRQAHCAARQDRMADAAAIYAALIERFPDSTHAPAALLGAGRSLFQADQFEAAAPWLVKAIEAGGPGVTEAAHWLCQVHLRLRRADQALKLAQRWLPSAGEDPFAPNLQLDQADALFEIEGRRAEALDTYLELYRAHPQHDVAPLALYDAAFTALDLQRYPLAAELAARFLEAFPEHTLAPDTRYIVAECHVKQKDYPAAEAVYRQLLDTWREHPQRETWQVRLGLVLYLKQQYQATLELLNPLADQLQAPESKAESLHLIGLSQFQLERWSDAAESLQASILADARWRQADLTLLYLARAQRKLDQIQQALTTVETMLERFPDSSLLDQVRYDRAEYRYAGDQYAEATAAYDELLERHPQSTYVPFALYGRGWSLLKSGHFDAAIASFSKLLNEHPEHQLRDDARFARGMCYRQAERYAEAIADIDAYLQSIGPGLQRADALYERGLSQAGAREFPQAAASFTTLLADHPEYPDTDKVLYELGWAHRLNKDPEGAVTAFATLVEKFPDSPLAAEADFHVGEDHYSHQRYAEAVQAYRRSAAANDPALLEKVTYKLGWSHYQLKQYRESLAQFEGQLAANPDGPLAADAWFMKGESLFHLNDYAAALPALVESIARPASSPEIAMLRELHAGQAAIELEKWREAVGFLGTLIESHPDSRYVAEAHFERGRARHRLNQLSEALADFQHAADAARGALGTRAQFMVGEMRFLQKRHEEAIKDFQRAMFHFAEADADPEIGNWQAKAGFEAGRCGELLIESASSPMERAQRASEAAKSYRYVIEKHPNHPLAAQAKTRLAALEKL